MSGIFKKKKKKKEEEEEEGEKNKTTTPHSRAKGNNLEQKEVWFQSRTLLPSRRRSVDEESRGLYTFPPSRSLYLLSDLQDR